MTGFLEDNLLRLEGLDDADIAKLNAALPALAAAVKALQPHLPGLVVIVEKIIAKQQELKS